LWDRWKRGESLKAIGRAFGKPSSSIYFLVAPHGGIRPAERRRSRLALTLAEREVISRGITAHQSARSMARLLGRSPSTVSREMSRNGGYDRYRATLADENAWARVRRPKYCKLETNSRLRQAVAGKLRLDWSPEQIAGWLKRTHPEDGCNQVSHETIYRSLFVQTRGVLKKELLRHLRSRRTMRRSKPVDPNGDRRGHIKDIVSIRQRPAAVEDRAVPGHWEGDLLSGPNNSYIATLVERHTRYVMLAKVAGKDTQTVVSALIKQAKKLPKELYKSLTWDRGKELTDHRRFTLATNIDVYFCDPQSPWQRGSSAHDWRNLLLDLKRRGLDVPPRLVIADGALGFWKAAGEVWPKTREQRCWVHKTANVLAKLPKSQQPKAKRALFGASKPEQKAEHLRAPAFAAAWRLSREERRPCFSDGPKRS
jgi:IS30 family transposase